MSIIEKGLFIVALSCRSYDAMNLLRVSVPYIFRKSDKVQLCYLEKREEGDTVEYFMNGMLHNINDNPAVIIRQDSIGVAIKMWFKFGKRIGIDKEYDSRFKCVTDYGIRV